MTDPAPHPPGRLSGRIALITGSSGRLGRAISLLFAREGATLFLADKYRHPRNPVNATTGKADDWETRLDLDSAEARARLDPSLAATDNPAELARRYQPTDTYIQSLHGAAAATFHAADLTSEPSVVALVAACVSLHGRIDILINAHGVSVESTHPTPLPLHLTPLSDLATTLAINTTSLFLTMKHFLALHSAAADPPPPQRFSGGRAWVVNVASVQGLTPYFGTPAYCASKGAAVMLTRQAALDYAPLGVRVNAVCPGFLDSDMTRNLRGDPRVLGAVAARHPLRVAGDGGGVTGPGRGPGQGGLGDVEDVARMVLVLASDDARWMTGQAVVVDGGYSVS